MLQRSPSYIATVPARNPVANLLRRALPGTSGSTVARWMMALGTQGSYQLSRRRPALVKSILRAGARIQLPRGYDVDTHFTPRYDPWDQRLCAAPDGDFFRAIRKGRATVVTDRVERFIETGIRLESGAELDADIVVSATGLELLFMGGMALTVDGEVAEVAGRLTYKGMMLEGVPNLAVAIGYTNASWTLKCELTSDYLCRLLNHMRDSGLRQCTPENADAGITAEPLLGLSSGYMTRAADRLPRQGSRAPWRVYQSYLADHRALKRSRVDVDAMVFSNPVEAATTEPVRPTVGSPA